MHARFHLARVPLPSSSPRSKALIPEVYSCSTLTIKLNLTHTARTVPKPSFPNILSPTLKSRNNILIALNTHVIALVVVFQLRLRLPLTTKTQSAVRGRTLQFGFDAVLEALVGYADRHDEGEDLRDVLVRDVDFDFELGRRAV